MVYDLFTYNGEADMLELRFNILSPYVDKFIICESTQTFSGNPKPLYWAERGDRFEEWEDKVIYQVISDFSDSEIIEQMNDREYVDQASFQRAFYQKEYLRKTLESLNPIDEDVIYYGDVDEVWTPQEIDDTPHKLRQIAYSYYLNNRSPEDWRGTVVMKYKNLKSKCLNDFRAHPKEEDIRENGGWHFTNLGGIDAIRLKIQSYDHQEVNIPIVTNGLEERLANNMDFLGRDFQFWVDESELPQYILDNKEKYIHLWK